MRISVDPYPDDKVSTWIAWCYFGGRYSPLSVLVWPKQKFSGAKTDPEECVEMSFNFPYAPGNWTATTRVSPAEALKFLSEMGADIEELDKILHILEEMGWIDWRQREKYRESYS